MVSGLDFFLTDRLFVTAPFVEYYRDFFQNISNRVSPGVSLGYEVLDAKRVFIDVSGGAAYQYTSFFAGAPATNDFAIVLGTNINFHLPRGIEWDNLYRVNVVVTNIGQTSHHAVSVLSFDIWGPLDLEASLTFDRIESPVGVGIVSNDYRYGIGLGLDF